MLRHAAGILARSAPQGTASEISELLAADLTRYISRDLSVTVSNTTLSGGTYMNISVDFPLELMIPLAGMSTITLTVDTFAPLLSPTT